MGCRAHVAFDGDRDISSMAKGGKANSASVASAGYDHSNISHEDFLPHCFYFLNEICGHVNNREGGKRVSWI